MEEREQLNLKIRSSKKEEWEEFVDESDTIFSVTDLVRASVSKFIAEKQGEGGEDNLQREFFTDQFEQLEGRIDRIEDATSRIKEQQVYGDELEETIQYAALRANEEFWEAEGVDLQALPKTDEDIERR